MRFQVRLRHVPRSHERRCSSYPTAAGSFCKSPPKAGRRPFVATASPVTHWSEGGDLHEVAVIEPHDDSVELRKDESNHVALSQVAASHEHQLWRRSPEREAVEEVEILGHERPCLPIATIRGVWSVVAFPAGRSDVWIASCPRLAEARQSDGGR